MNKCDGRIILVGKDGEGYRNSMLDFKFCLENPPTEDLVSTFENVFNNAFADRCVIYECMAVYIPLRIGFYWDSVENLVNPREFFIAKCECLSNANENKRERMNNG